MEFFVNGPSRQELNFLRVKGLDPDGMDVPPLDPAAIADLQLPAFTKRPVDASRPTGAQVIDSERAVRAASLLERMNWLY